MPRRYGALRAGAAVVPMNVLLKEREVAFHVGDSEAKLLLAWHEFADAAAPASSRPTPSACSWSPASSSAMLERDRRRSRSSSAAGDDTALILYTSGTTGTPKGAELTHDNLLRNVEATVGIFGLDERSVTLGALPFFHAFGQTCALNATDRCRRVPDVDPALRRRQGAGDP